MMNFAAPRYYSRLLRRGRGGNEGGGRARYDRARRGGRTRGRCVGTAASHLHSRVMTGRSLRECESSSQSRPRFPDPSFLRTICCGGCEQWPHYPVACRALTERGGERRNGEVPLFVPRHSRSDRRARVCVYSFPHSPCVSCVSQRVRRLPRSRRQLKTPSPTRCPPICRKMTFARRYRRSPLERSSCRVTRWRRRARSWASIRTMRRWRHSS